MQFGEAIKVALQSLWANKMRTILTILGVIIGVASVIAVITLVNGANLFVVKKVARKGSDTLTLTRLPPVIFTGEEYLKVNKRKNIDYDDFLYLQRTCSRCLVLAAQLGSSGKIVSGKQSSDNTTINGWTSNMAEISDQNIVLGRPLTPTDDGLGTHDIVVGADVVDNVLPPGDPIGQELRVDGEIYTVIGVVERQGSMFGQSQDNFVDMPLSTYLHTHGQHQSITISAKAGMAPGALDSAIDQVRALMRSRRHGVVIMNIMLVSVTERTREIGIRKALGAKRQDVMLQFLIESAAMSLLGGLFGVIGGVTVAEVVTHLVGFPSAIALWSVVLGLFVATSVGIFFGVYPAHKAAQLDPIVALRAEL